jgi:hypothetical protein
MTFREFLEANKKEYFISSFITALSGFGFYCASAGYENEALLIFPFSFAFVFLMMLIIGALSNWS